MQEYEVENKKLVDVGQNCYLCEVEESDGNLRLTKAIIFQPSAKIDAMFQAYLKEENMGTLLEVTVGQASYSVRPLTPAQATKFKYFAAMFNDCKSIAARDMENNFFDRQMGK